jgi:hemolysin-activating ACP:hemolysin acyltransferase
MLSLSLCNSSQQNKLCCIFGIFDVITYLLRTEKNLQNEINTEDFRESEVVDISYVNWANFSQKTHWEGISTDRRNLNGKGGGINLARNGKR